MSKAIVAALLFFLISTCARADEPTFEDLKAQFKAEAVAMANDNEVDMHNIMERLAEMAQRIFGPYPEIIKAEALRLYDEMPEFDPESLREYTAAEKTEDLIAWFMGDPGENYDRYLLAWGVGPSRKAIGLKRMFLSRRIPTEEFVKRSMLSNFIPEKAYKFTEGEQKRVVVEYLDEYFIIEVSLTDAGVFAPQSLTWMKRKPAE